MCEICHTNPCNPRCPNYVLPLNTWPLSHPICSVCGDPIFVGEQYIENCDAQFAHYDCIHSKENLRQWLKCEIKIMEE